jgi:hypothetical protein
MISNQRCTSCRSIILPGEILIAGRVVATGQLKEELLSSDAVWKVGCLGQRIAATFSRNSEVLLEVRNSQLASQLAPRFCRIIRDHSANRIHVDLGSTRDLVGI